MKRIYYNRGLATITIDLDGLHHNHALVLQYGIQKYLDGADEHRSDPFDINTGRAKLQERTDEWWYDMIEQVREEVQEDD